MRENGHFGGLPWKLDSVVISYVQSEKNQDAVGKSVEEIAAERGEDPLETYLALMDEEDNQVGCVAHNRVESDVRYFLTHALAMIGSDGNAISPTGLYASDKPSPALLRHLPTHPGPVRSGGVADVAGDGRTQDDGHAGGAAEAL